MHTLRDIRVWLSAGVECLKIVRNASLADVGLGSRLLQTTLDVIATYGFPSSHLIHVCYISLFFYFLLLVRGVFDPLVILLLVSSDYSPVVLWVSDNWFHQQKSKINWFWKGPMSANYNRSECQNLKINTSKTGSPVSLERAAISSTMVPAQAVHVSWDHSSLWLFRPYLRFIWQETLH